MFVEFQSEGSWGRARYCPSCKRPIGPGEPTENLKLDFDPENGLHELNGLYHAVCAKPYLSVLNAMHSLNRWSGG